MQSKVLWNSVLTAPALVGAALVISSAAMAAEVVSTKIQSAADAQANAQANASLSRTATA